MKFKGFKKVKLHEAPEEYIAKSINPETHKIIAITGAAGSGKTSFGKNLKKLLPCKTTMVNVDDYFAYDLVTRMREKISGYNWNSRKKDLFLRQMKSLRKGKSIQKSMFSYKTQSVRKEKEKVVPEKNIIIEGTLDFSDVADFVIFTWAPDEVLINRVVKRGGFRTVFKTRKSLRKHFEEISIVNYRKLLLPHISKADIVFDTLNNEIYE
ncbi:MAG: AAA family ATPase [Patescibacteria group bacterium]|nr:AAA family ATPase [Patescibacteria group bacterium]